jgi:hypothetical protein
MPGVSRDPVSGQDAVLPSSSTSRTAPALNFSVKLRRIRFFDPVAIRAIVSALHLASYWIGSSPNV